MLLQFAFLVTAVQNTRVLLNSKCDISSLCVTCEHHADIHPPTRVRLTQSKIISHSQSVISHSIGRAHYRTYIFALNSSGRLLKLLRSKGRPVALINCSYYCEKQRSSTADNIYRGT